MVKCANCGYLAQHVYRGKIPQGFIAMEEEPRQTGELPTLPFSLSFHTFGEPDLTPEKMNGDRFPVCFCRAFHLKQEIDNRFTELESSENGNYEDAVKEIINKERSCKQFIDWERGFTPKEHREMRDRAAEKKWRVLEVAIIVLGNILAGGMGALLVWLVSNSAPKQ